MSLFRSLFFPFKQWSLNSQSSLFRPLPNLFDNCIGKTCHRSYFIQEKYQPFKSNFLKTPVTIYTRNSTLVNKNNLYQGENICSFLSRSLHSFLSLHKRGPLRKRKKKNPLGDKPQAKGVVLKVFTKKPKKPNSANRKCVLLRLSTGKEMTAHVPGEGHNLQEHNVVLVRVGRLRDTPGVKLKCVRGKYDLPHVIKKRQV